jgi:transketolase
MNVKPNRELQEQCINTIRILSADAVQNANAGHPGMPMGAAAMAYTLWTQFLKHNPRNPQWFDRDRFVLSAGHGSMLLYSLLFLSGYDLPIEEIRHFRKWGSKTPGHPERGVTPGVEVTTGPLGQGFANGVGMAIAEDWLAQRYNRQGTRSWTTIPTRSAAMAISWKASVRRPLHWPDICGWGSSIYLYDQNHISLAGATEIDFTEDVARRFAANGWHTRVVPDGNDTEDVARAIREAQAEDRKPSLILARTHIGYGSPHKQDNFTAHGDPLLRRGTAGHQESPGLADRGKVLPPRGCDGVFSPSHSSGRGSRRPMAKAHGGIQGSVPTESRRIRERHQRQAPARLGRRSSEVETHR